MNNLYKITIIITPITLIIAFWIEYYIDYKCNSIMITNTYEEFTLERCIRLHSYIFSNSIFTYLLYTSHVLVLLSIIWLISDWIRFIWKKIMKLKKN